MGGKEGFLEEVASGLSSKGPMKKTCQVKDTRGKGTCRQRKRNGKVGGGRTETGLGPLLSLDKPSVCP